MIVGGINITKQAEFDRLAGELAAEDPQWYEVDEAHDLLVWTDALCAVKAGDFEAWHTVSLSPRRGTRLSPMRRTTPFPASRSPESSTRPSRSDARTRRRC